MSMTYDTKEIRRIARELSALSASVTAAASGTARRTADEMPVHFRGAAANELKTALNGMFKDIHTTASGLNKMANALMTYARLLDIADQGFMGLINDN